VDVVEREEEERGAAEDLKSVADQDDLAPVEAVGHMAGRQHEDESGKKKREAGIAEVDSAVRDEIDLPGDGERLRLGSDHDHDARKLIAAKIAGLEGRGGSGGGRVGHACFVYTALGALVARVSIRDAIVLLKACGASPYLIDEPILFGGDQSFPLSGRFVGSAAGCCAFAAKRYQASHTTPCQR
jgi:hypothetical protein